MKPVVKWIGGKRKLLPALEASLPELGRDHVFFEPFAGGLSTTFGLMPSRAVVGDTNGALVNCYRQIQGNGYDELIARLTAFDSRKDWDTEGYNENRARFNALLLAQSWTPEQAALFMWLNKYCHSGLYRTNKQGEFNASFCNEPYRKVFDGEHLAQVRAYLRDSVIIRFGDVAQTLDGVKAGDMVFLDPPYLPDVNVQDSFVKYGAATFGLRDHERLATLSASLTEQGVYVLLTNVDHPLIPDLYPGWTIDRNEGSWTVSHGRGKKTARREVIVSNQKLVDVL